MPEHVARAVAIEVADAGRLPTGRMRTNMTLALQCPSESIHTSVWPVAALYQSTSLVPSLLKSPAPATA